MTSSPRTQPHTRGFSAWAGLPCSDLPVLEGYLFLLQNCCIHLPRSCSFRPLVRGALGSLSRPCVHSSGAARPPGGTALTHCPAEGAGSRPTPGSQRQSCHLSPRCSASGSVVLATGVSLRIQGEKAAGFRSASGDGREPPPGNAVGAWSRGPGSSRAVSTDLSPDLRAVCMLTAPQVYLQF